MLRFLATLLRSYTKEDKKLIRSIRSIIGKRPINLEVYKLALRHTSAAKELHTGFRESNERLEYLGDAILGFIVAEYLFKRYPFKEEGFLTEIRSRIVNRESLNRISKKLNLHHLIFFEGNISRKMSHKSMAGDAFEAFIGAIYLDRGFKFSRNFIIKKVIQPHLDIEKIIDENKNFKSFLIEWAQKHNHEVRFEIIKERGMKHQREFIAQVFIDDQPKGIGTGYSKKKAEQLAAEKTCEVLGLFKD